MKFKKLIMGALATLALVAGTVSAQSGDMSHEAIAKRLAPVGELCLQGDDCGGAPTAASSGGGDGAKSGEEIYGQVCTACHDTGAAGAPKRGDAEAWSSRMEKGMDTLYSHAIDGFNAMPAKGGNPSLTEDDVKRAVNHLVEPVFEGELPAVGGGAEEGAAEGEQAQASADTGDEDAAAQASGDLDGEALYASAPCAACHASGAAGAPVLGDAEAWATRIDKGTEALYESALNGIGAMPPKGGASLPDAEVKAIVDYMVSQAQ